MYKTHLNNHRNHVWPLNIALEYTVNSRHQCYQAIFHKDILVNCWYNISDCIPSNYH